MMMTPVSVSVNSNYLSGHLNLYVNLQKWYHKSAKDALKYVPSIPRDMVFKCSSPLKVMAFPVSVTVSGALLISKV